MSKLSQLKCEACRPDAPKATEEEIKQVMPSIPQWEIVKSEGLDKLKRVFQCKKYSETLALLNAIAEISEQENHHPVMLFEFRQLTVFWWSHKMAGLHMNDFILAAKCDEVYGELTK